mmetsp:Transcript_7183/g.22667  ORF Transcript_7183/g.22667 Transcript_7183/m.22667 type:complete len:227 (-) Transcript_7183:529-1209(-)
MAFCTRSRSSASASRVASSSALAWRYIPGAAAACMRSIPKRTPPHSIAGGMDTSATNMPRCDCAQAAARPRRRASVALEPLAQRKRCTKFAPTPKQSMSVPSDSVRQSGNAATRSVLDASFASKMRSNGVAAYPRPSNDSVSALSPRPFLLSPFSARADAYHGAPAHRFASQFGNGTSKTRGSGRKSARSTRQAATAMYVAAAQHQSSAARRPELDGRASSDSAAP